MNGRLVVAVLATLALVTGAGLRESVAGEPTDALRKGVDAALKTLQDKSLAGEARARERREALSKVATGIFDFRETARRALGRHWRDRSDAERQEFVKLFTELLEESYFSKIDQYQGEKIAYLGDTVEGDQATVRTRIITPKRSEIPVDYRMLREGSDWRVFDVSIEGVSLVANYRTQFNKIIQTSSYDELVKKLRAKTLSASGTASPANATR